MTTNSINNLELLLRTSIARYGRDETINKVYTELLAVVFDGHELTSEFLDMVEQSIIAYSTENRVIN